MAYVWGAHLRLVRRTGQRRHSNVEDRASSPDSLETDKLRSGVIGEEGCLCVCVCVCVCVGVRPQLLLRNYWTKPDRRML